MSAFDLIKKRLFIKPWVIAAKINASGYGSYQVLTQTPEQCTIAFARKYHGKGWTDLPPVSYTLVEAKAHGLINRSPHWQSSPAHMLYQRAMGRGGAMYFPELLAGLEPPQDDTPIPAERHRQNIVDLFGDGAGSYAPQRHTPKNAREGTVLQRTDVEQGVDTQEANYGPVSGLKSASTPSTMQGAAWDTLRAHQDDARLPPEILERIAAALSPLAPTTDTEALALADVVLQWVDSFDDSNVEE